MNWYYERNDELIQSSVNKTFEEILWMTEDEFTQWVKDLRSLVIDLWDNQGIPPRVGFSKDEMIDNFRKMLSYPVHEFEIENLDTGVKDVIRNTSIIGNAVNQFFPTMMATKITNSTAENAKSIYDWFKEEALFDRFRKYSYRNFKRDSFYHYSNPIMTGQVLDFGSTQLKVTDDYQDFISWFEENGSGLNWDWFFGPVKEDYEYTGYNTELKSRKNLILTIDEIIKLDIPEKNKTHVKEENGKLYQIRVFKFGQKLFPIGLKAFKVTFSQYAVNFPPLTAKFLYQKYTKHIKKQPVIKIYDPSMGWGGRLLGALSLDNSQKFLYIGTDPNTDHNTSEGRTKYHEIADFFNSFVRDDNSLFPEVQDTEFYQLGSEVIGDDPKFKKHEGSLDLVFTSPPYFAKEVYSDDPEQSCHKFTTYEDWRDGFLKPTLETAVKFLKSDRYLLWNIADVDVKGKLLPLEDDSNEILKSLGMEYVETMKMALASMPGSNRFIQDGETEEVVSDVFGSSTIKKPILKGRMKNFCRINSVSGKETMSKFEPVYVWRKP